MAFTIIKSDEPLPPKNLLVVLYGQPNTYKTSLAFTADESVLFDFDKGVQRAVGRTTIIKMDCWQDAEDALASNDFKELGVKTLIMDTGGTMLDNFIGDHVMQANHSNKKRGGGISLEGYGAMRDVFKAFKNRCGTLGVDIVIVCHQSKDNDTSQYIPKMTGSSYDIMVAEADLVGYMYSADDAMRLDFNPTDRHIGKNSPEFEAMKLPHYTDPKWKTYLSDIIQKTKDRMTQMSEQQTEAVKLVAGYIKDIGKAKTLDDLEEMLPDIDQLTKVYNVQVITVFSTKYVELWKKDIQEAKDAEALNAKVGISTGLDKRWQRDCKTALVEYGKTVETAELCVDKEDKVNYGKFVAKEPKAKKEAAPKAKEKEESDAGGK